MELPGSISRDIEEENLMMWQSYLQLPVVQATNAPGITELGRGRAEI